MLGLKLCLLQWQADCLRLSHQGSHLVWSPSSGLRVLRLNLSITREEWNLSCDLPLLVAVLAAKAAWANSDLLMSSCKCWVPSSFLLVEGIEGNHEEWRILGLTEGKKERTHLRSSSCMPGPVPRSQHASSHRFYRKLHLLCFHYYLHLMDKWCLLPKISPAQGPLHQQSWKQKQKK